MSESVRWWNSHTKNVIQHNKKNTFLKLGIKSRAHPYSPCCLISGRSHPFMILHVYTWTDDATNPHRTGRKVVLTYGWADPFSRVTITKRAKIRIRNKGRAKNTSHGCDRSREPYAPLDPYSLRSAVASLVRANHGRVN